MALARWWAYATTLSMCTDKSLVIRTPTSRQVCTIRRTLPFVQSGLHEVSLPICRMQNGQLPHYRPFIQWVQGTLQLITTTLSTVSVYIFTSSANNFRLTLNVFKCSIKSLTKTRMWADAQCDGRPAEYRWCRLRKFRNSIPCTKPQSLADACCWSAMQ